MVRIHPDPPGSAARPRLEAGRGAVAQLGEHLLCKQGVVGSIPSSSTNRARRRAARWRQPTNGGREIRPQRPERGVAVWFFNRNRLLFNNWEEANKRTTQLGRALG